MKEKNKSRADDLQDLESVCEEYLWDPTAKGDPLVEELEKLLSPMGFDPDKKAWSPGELTTGSSHGGSRRLLWGILSLGGIAAAVLLGLGLILDGQQSSQEDSQQVSLTTESGRSLGASSVYVAERDADRLLLGKNGSLADLELTRGSRLAILSLDAKKTILELQEGEMDAFVTSKAKPGFFNVDTPATRCVDLGCQYRLSVDRDGKAHVKVILGRVAFRDDRKPWRNEVFVPHGANCTADPIRGSGTPRYDGISSSLEQLLDGFDALETSRKNIRRELAVAFMAQAMSKEDMLPVWHFLQDPDPLISRSAADKLRLGYGMIPGIPLPAGKDDGVFPDASEQAIWREFLWPDPYR